MLNLSAKNIQLNRSAASKEDAIKLVAQGLVENGNVESGYENGMLTRETQTSTFLGNGIAIPHGTLDTRGLVKETGVQIVQFPQGVQWGDSNIAYVAIGIAAKSDEHLTLLRQLTSVLSDETAADKLAKTDDLQEFIDILSGKKSQPTLSTDLITLNVETSSLVTLSAINAAKLQEQGYVNQSFISDVLASEPLPLGDNLFVADSRNGNLANGLAIARCTKGNTLVTVAASDNAIESTLACLLNTEVRQQLTHSNAAQIVAILSGETAAEPAQTATNHQVIGTFTVRNDNGLHARPVAMLVNILKPFTAKITVENLARGSAAVNAKSTMRVVGLGATKGSRLRFVAEGDDAQQALETLQTAFAAGLGEPVSFEPEVADSIENAVVQAVETGEKFAEPATNAEPSLEAVFVIHNEHGLHARPSTVLVNEVKKYAAKIEVQNLDRNSPLVSAKSLMKIVSLGVTKGTNLRFVATGADAQAALDGIKVAIEAGLGE